MAPFLYNINIHNEISMWFKIVSLVDDFIEEIQYIFYFGVLFDKIFSLPKLEMCFSKCRELKALILFAKIELTHPTTIDTSL